MTEKSEHETQPEFPPLPDEIKVQEAASVPAVTEAPVAEVEADNYFEAEPLVTVTEQTASTVEQLEQSTPVVDEDVKSKEQLTSVEIHYPINTGETCDNGDTLFLPSDTEENIRKAIQLLPNEQISDSRQLGMWKAVLNGSLGYQQQNNSFIKTLQDPTAQFTQKPMFNNIEIGLRPARFSQKDNAILTGADATYRAIQAAGLGVPYDIALWHSGIRITVTPPTERELIEFHRIVMNDRIQFGRMTYGFVFSNIAAFTLRRIMDLVIPHISTTTLNQAEVPIGNILNHILVTDIPLIIQGFAASMYQKGFNYRRACTGTIKAAEDETETVCGNVFTDVLNLSKLPVVNMAQLTEWQKSHMSTFRPNTKSLESVKRYQDEMVRAANCKIDVYDGIQMELRIPTIAEHIDQGYEWVIGITEAVNSVLTLDTTDDIRNAAITEHGLATAMRQYRHNIDKLYIGTNTIEKPEDISNAIDRWSANDTIREKFFTEVQAFVDRATVSVIGIPKFHCSKCKELNEGKQYPHLDEYIPLEPYQLFFGLVSQRMKRIMAR